MSNRFAGEDGAHNRTVVECKGERELVATRTFEALPSTVYMAWSRPELFQLWWMPKSISDVSLISCAMDVRTGGEYRLEFSAGGSDTRTFCGKYREVVPNERLVWTNDESEERAVTTVTFGDHGGKTLLTFHEAYPSSKALEEALQGSAAGLLEQFDQLDQLLPRINAA